MENQNSKSIQKILLIIAIVNVSFFISLSYLIFIMQGKRLFGDFAETLSYCIVKNPYSGEFNEIKSIYPPLAYLPLYIFALIAKKPISNYLMGSLTLNELSIHPALICSFILFYIICLSIVLFLSAKISKFKGIKLVSLIACIISFGPMVYGFVRGNNIILVLVLVMFFFWLYNSEKKWQKEIANICLAGAIAIKLYPIIIMLFLIKDRRFLDMCKIIVYSLILILFPFIFIDGGFYNLKYIFHNCIRFSLGESRQIGPTNISFDALAYDIAINISNILGINKNTLYSSISIFLRFTLVITTIILLFLSKKSKLNMQITLLTILTYELFMSVSYCYTLIFLIIPIIYFLINFENYSLFNKCFYGLSFLLIANTIFAYLKDYTFIRYVLLALVIKVIIDLTKDFFVQRKENKSLKDESNSHKIETTN